MKFEAAFLHLNDVYALWAPGTLQKDLNSWAELQASTFRVHCTYMVRLWRKTKNNSKCFGVIVLTMMTSCQL